MTTKKYFVEALAEIDNLFCDTWFESVKFGVTCTASTETFRLTGEREREENKKNIILKNHCF